MLKNLQMLAHWDFEIIIGNEWIKILGSTLCVK